MTARWYHILLAIISVWLLYNLKYYYLAVLLPILIVSLLYQKFIYRLLKNRSFGVEVLAWLTLFFVSMLFVIQLHPNFYLHRFLGVIYNNYLDFVTFSQPGDVMLFPNLKESWSSVFINIPWALISGLFRPFIWEVSNTLQLLASVENLLLVFITITAIPSLFTFNKRTDRVLIFSILVYCFILCVFLTLSTPNFGTLIRYRVGFIPFLCFSLPSLILSLTKLLPFCKLIVQTL